MTDLSSNYVWVVESLADDAPSLLSVHTDKQSAYEARAGYINHYRHGGTEADYWVHTMKLNFTGLSDD